MAHLGERVTALVDGRLAPDAAERARVHLAACQKCREVVEGERLMKARLVSLRAPSPGEDLMQRLLALGGPNGPLRPRTGYVPGTPRPRAVTLPRATVPVAARSAGHHGGPAALAAPLTPALVVDHPTGRQGFGVRRRRGPGGTTRPSAAAGAGRAAGPSRGGGRRRRPVGLAVAVFGALSVVGAGITVLTLGGAAAGSPSPTVVPPVDTFVIDHAQTTDMLPFADVPTGWQLVQIDQAGGASR